MIASIEKKYEENGYGFISGSELYIKMPFALKFIEECNRMNLLILGVEGFELLENKGIMPRMDMIIDFSEVYNNFLEKNWKSLREFCIQYSDKMIKSFSTEGGNKNLIFNFVLLEESDYNKDKLKLQS